MKRKIKMLLFKLAIIAAIVDGGLAGCAVFDYLFEYNGESVFPIIGCALIMIVKVLLAVIVLLYSFGKILDIKDTFSEKHVEC